MTPNAERRPRGIPNPSPTFVGRRDEIDLLGAALRDAAEARPRIVLIEGDAGVGKTALLRQFAASLGGEAALLHASGDEVERDLPNALLGMLLRPVAATVGPQLADLLDPDRPVADPLTLGNGLVDLLGQLQEDGPVAVLIDDVHWADQASLRALSFAARRLVADRVVLLLAGRTGELGGVPSGLRHLADHVVLNGLDAVELVELAKGIGAPRLSSAAARALHDETGGNPLFAAAALQSGPVDVIEKPPLPVPERYAAGVEARTAACAPATQRLLKGLSVWGMEADLARIADLTGLADPLPAVTEAVDARLLELRGEGASSTIAFTHPLTRATTYHGMDAEERAAMHRAAAARATEPLTSLRHRVLGTVTYDEGLATDLESLAQTEADGAAWASAAWAAQAAGRLSARREDEERRTLMAIDYAIGGGEAATVTALAAGIDGFADTPRKHCVLGALAMVQGRGTHAEAFLRRAWGELGDPDVDPDLADAVCGWMAVLHVNLGLADGAVEWATRVVRRAREGHVGSVNIAPAVATLWIALGADGPATIEWLLGDLQLGDDPNPARTALILGRAVVRVWMDRPAAALQDLQAVLPVLRRRGPFVDLLVALLYLGETAYRMGNWDDAVMYGELAVSAAEDAEQAFTFTLAHGAAAWPLAGRGQWEAAAAHVAAAKGSVAFGPMLWSALAEARLAHAQGDASGVFRALHPIYASGRSAGLRNPSVQPWEPLYAEGLVGMGRYQEAEEVIRGMERTEGPTTDAATRAGTARARGLLETANGDANAAVQQLTRAVELTLRGAQPFFEARSREALGAALAKAGHPRDAERELVAARALYESLGAVPYLERIDTRRGSSTRRRPSRNRFALSPQEASVATLVTRGMTNREVAQELVVSVKTVEYHLANVYAKLGVRSRSQLTRMMLTTSG